MRNIKFRAWVDGMDSPFITPDGDFTLHLNGSESEVNVWVSDGVLDSLPIEKLEQFTGLQDKNGVEIYEGDIVTDHSIDIDERGIYAVKWSQASLTHTIDGECLCDFANGILQVLGNAYENPELLEKEK